MLNSDFTTILKDVPPGDWIALSQDQDRVVATAIKLKDAVELAHINGEANPVMMKVPSHGSLVL